MGSDGSCSSRSLVDLQIDRILVSPFDIGDRDGNFLFAPHVAFPQQDVRHPQGRLVDQELAHFPHRAVQGLHQHATLYGHLPLREQAVLDCDVLRLDIVAHFAMHGHIGGAVGIACLAIIHLQVTGAGKRRHLQDSIEWAVEINGIPCGLLDPVDRDQALLAMQDGLSPPPQCE